MLVERVVVMLVVIWGLMELHPRASTLVVREVCMEAASAVVAMVVEVGVVEVGVVPAPMVT